jgi:hypothetical protein
MLIAEGLLIDVKHKRGLAEEAIQSIEDEIQNLYIKVRLHVFLFSTFICICIENCFQHFLLFGYVARAALKTA